MSKHETTRPCFNCAMRALLAEYHIEHDYTTPQLLSHITDVLADLVASTANDGHEALAAQTIKDLFAVQLEEAFAAEEQRRADHAANPKTPTTTDVGHA